MRKNDKKTQILLEKAKKTVLAFVMDQDGTVKGGDDVVELLKKIARKNKYPAIITASGASALRSISSMNDFYSQEKVLTPTFIGIGNGTALYRFDTSGRTEIYNHNLTLGEVKAIVTVWKKVYEVSGIKEADLQPKGIKTFKKFMTTDWTGYIPEKYIDIFKLYDGRCFTEPIKVTVVFPVLEVEKQRELVKKIQAALDRKFGKGKYLASRGDETFLHITHTFNVDPKLFALQTIMKELKLTKKQVIAFGDMPLDNDRGLLIESRLPYTFTNSYFEKKDFRKLPFILPGSSESPVGSVYQAIDYLLY
jgi:hydroxymethylpyrimidine pyrophosphatase-like HAD family hydrolase